MFLFFPFYYFNGWPNKLCCAVLFVFNNKWTLHHCVGFGYRRKLHCSKLVTLSRLPSPVFGQTLSAAYQSDGNLLYMNIQLNWPFIIRAVIKFSGNICWRWAPSDWERPMLTFIPEGDSLAAYNMFHTLKCVRSGVKVYLTVGLFGSLLW